MAKSLLLFLFMLLFKLNGLAQQTSAIPEDVKRIVFLGNSITYAGHYISYVETYFRLKHPEFELEWINVGLPSETVSGLSEEGHAGGDFPRPDLHERLDRVFEQLKPDLVFVNYGMNDGIYLPLDDSRFLKYKNGINWLSSKIDSIDAKAVYVTSPIYDSKKGEAYANVLDFYATWLISKRYSDQWQVVDIHWPMRKFLEDRRKADSSFFLAEDGVHPNEVGHWLMAKEILLFLGETEVRDFDDFQSAIEPFSEGEALFQLIQKRQFLLRDAWLSSTGHLRPGIKQGLPVEEAERKAKEIEAQIQLILK